jgi:hypothetical protein
LNRNNLSSYIESESFFSHKFYLDEFRCLHNDGFLFNRFSSFLSSLTFRSIRSGGFFRKNFFFKDLFTDIIRL